MKKLCRKGHLKRSGKRWLALLMSVCLIGTMIPITARAENGSTDTGLCEHHTEHTAECGYVAPARGHECEHVHDESCGYQEAGECTHVHTEECGENGESCAHVHDDQCGYAEGHVCEHVHDEECGYVEASEGSPCTFACEICGKEAATVQAESKLITDWEWVDDWEIIHPDSGNVLLPFASAENVAYFDNIVEMLPSAIQADGEELTLGEWVCEDYPMESGAYEGWYVFETTLPDGYTLSDDTNVLYLTVVLGDPEGHKAADKAAVYAYEPIINTLKPGSTFDVSKVPMGNLIPREYQMNESGEYTLTGRNVNETTMRFVINKSCTIILDNVKIISGLTYEDDGKNMFMSGKHGIFEVAEGVSVDFVFRGSNDIQSKRYYKSLDINAIMLGQGSKVTFSGPGVLDLKGGIAGKFLGNNSAAQATVVMKGGRVDVVGIGSYRFTDYRGGGGYKSEVINGTIELQYQGGSFHNSVDDAEDIAERKDDILLRTSYCKGDNGRVRITGMSNSSIKLKSGAAGEFMEMECFGDTVYFYHDLKLNVVTDYYIIDGDNYRHFRHTNKTVRDDAVEITDDSTIAGAAGTVRVGGSTVSNATLTFTSDLFTGSCTTGENGAYYKAMPQGTYQVTITPSGSDTAYNLGTITLNQESKQTYDFGLTTLTGTVKDGNGSPVDKALVRFGEDGTLAYTDANGKYTIYMLQNKYASGTQVTASAQTLLYSKVTENVTFNTSGMTQDFVLKDIVTGDTLKVSSEADLVLLAGFKKQLNEKTIVLTQDIALTGQFKGITLTGRLTITIQGNGHTISNMTTPLFVNQTTDKNSQYQYLAGKVTDLHLQGDISWNGYALGALAERAKYITIEGCSFTGSITSTYEGKAGWSIGGLVGQLNDGTMRNCYVSVSLMKSNNTLYHSGGLCGDADSSSNDIENCYVRIGDYAVNAVSADLKSGILGIYRGTVKNCYVVVTGSEMPQSALGKVAPNATPTVKNVYVLEGCANDYTKVTKLSAGVMSAQAGTTVDGKKALVDRLNTNVSTSNSYKKWYNGTDGYPCFTIPTYTITFNGGTKGTGSQEALTVKAEESVTLPGVVYKNIDYVQKGWATSDGGTKAYDLSESISPAANMTLYPYWEAKPAAECEAPIGLTATYGDTLSNVSLPDGFTWNAPETSVGAVGTNTFTATYTPTGEAAEKYGKNTNVQISVEVKKALATYTTPVGAASNLAYNGAAQKLVTAGTTSHGTIVYSLTETETYTTEIPTAMNPGNYTVFYKIQGDANHEDSEVGSVTVPIGKANLKDAVITLGDALTYNGKEQTQSIASVTVGTMTLGAGDYTVTGNTKSAVGTYTLTVTGQGNFEGSKQAEFNIAKKAAVSVPDIDKKYVSTVGSNGAAASIDIASLLPNDRGATTYTLAENTATYVTDKAVSTDGMLTYKVGTNGNIGNSTTLTVTAASANYEDITVKVNIQIVDKYIVAEKEDAKVAITGSNTLIYGQTLSTLTLNTSAAKFVEQENPTKEVTGTLAWENPAAVLDAGTTTATWVFKPNDASYATVEDTVAITVNKATPQVTNLPTVAERTYHPTVSLTNSDLTGGTVTGVDGNPLGGEWSWQSSGIIPIVNNTGYVAVFTPSDSTNYETVTRTITVTVTKATPYIKTAPIAAAITYGDTLGASTLSGGTVQYSSSDATTVVGSFAWKDSSMKPSVSASNTMNYWVVFTPSDVDNYNTVETDITLIVNKAGNAPNKPSSTMNVANSCEKASDVTLPTGWVWQDAYKDTALTVGTAVTATAIYNGADKGNYENETISVTITRSACDHAHTEVRNAKAATCKEAGYTGDTYCKDCGELLTTGSIIPLADHQGGTATCTKKAVCTVCGKEYGTLDANNHVHTEIRGAVAATCTAGGYTGDTYCTDCGVKIKTGTATPALGHNYTSKVTTEPTTDREGVRTYTCDRCGHSYTESIPKLPEEEHEHSYSDSVTKEPTCTDTGIRTYTCSCGDSYTETIPALGHNYTSKVTKEPTTSSEGVMTYTCDRCGHSYTRAIAKLQDNNNNNPTDNNPGENNPGENQPGGENTPDIGKPYIKAETGKEGWEVIKAEVDKTQDGDTVVVEMNGSSVVPGDVLDEIKGKDVTIVFDMGNGITWSVNGQSITADRVSDIDFTVKTGTNTIPVDIINNVTGERYSTQISLAYDGEFGFTAVLSINMDAKNAGLYANLFYYNEKTGEMEFICYDEIAADGTAELVFTHASDYAIVIDTEPMDKPEQVTEPESESQSTEAESTQTGAEVNDDAWNPWWIIVIGVVVIVVGLCVLFVVKKKKEDTE
ncbi:MAG: InlB B-repeat-containing protein [Acetivibrio ethanolgignens]